MHNNNDDQDCIRIIIADDHTISRDGLKRLLETEPTFQVVGQAGDGHEAVQLAPQVKADVLLLDVAMPKVPGLETLRELNRNQIKIRTLLLTASIERSEILQALQLGAWGVVLKESPPELLLKSIKAIHAGEYRSEEHTSELQSQSNLVCRLLLEKKKKTQLAEEYVMTSSTIPETSLQL